jgi:hypothetical protein
MLQNYFPDNYRDGRRAFVAACTAAGLDTISRVHPSESGRDGLPLFLDTVSIGPREAQSALLVISGTHGVEGYFGSGALTGALREGILDAVPPTAKVVLLHALNPYGFSWDRRTDENNVDVNRNFVDHAAPPQNPAYDALANVLALQDISPTALTAADAALANFTQKHGLAALQRAISQGQYRHPGGLCFGGTAPCWSRKMLSDVLREELRHAKEMMVLDLHTGLGQPGISEIISDAPPESVAFRRAEAIWPRVKSSQGGAAISPPAFGQLCPALEADKTRQTTCVTLEIGTRPLPEIFLALRKDNWLEAAGRGHPQAAAIAREMRNAFFPAEANWQRKAFQAAQDAIAAVLPTLG